jgi:hypothetical protein
MNTIIGRPWTAGRIIKSMLLSDAGFVEVFGERLFPLVAPEGMALPLATYRLESTTREGGYLTGNSGLTTRVYEVALMGQDYDQIDEAATGLLARLESWRGQESDFKVRRVDISDESDEPYDRPEGGEDSPIFVRAFSVRMVTIYTPTALPDGSYGA